ncbi:MAG TPA: DinB family protein, partial [Gemmatimonadaceae bacterium]
RRHLMAETDALREQLARLLDWQGAHATFDQAVDGLPPALRGTAPAGVPYSPWQLLEHLRLTQRDILDFSRDPAYVEPTWPDDYWPAGAAPPDDAAWAASIDAFRADRAALQALARDPAADLFAPIPHGDGQTLLRELVLVADHNAYHVGELVLVRRLLGAWG